MVKMKLISEKDHERMLKYLDSEEEYISARVIYSLLLNGVRGTDIVRIEWENLRSIENGSKILELVSPKNSMHCTGYLLSKTSIESLLKLQDTANEKTGPVFRTASGKRMTAEALSRVLTKTFEKAGSESYSSSSVRKTGIMWQWFSVAPKSSQQDRDMVDAYLKEIDQK
ncbi:MAG: hypothetical protein COW52_04455 [Nitrospirae bacterium CG17_big_fil_post_rev_8_21_14_2_50_50_9]|nr:MAG: hypothetical protein COW52_04455 [Nitrospirae bacterium CG17_big_fil_post_rev_8_21_14_2_50_50_9]